MSDEASLRREAERVFHEYVERRAKGDARSPEEFAHTQPAEIRSELTELLRDYHTLLEGVDPEQSGVPRELGEFRLIRRLGEGANGVVWEAEQKPLKRRVALKLLRPHFLLSARARERFSREAVAGGRLKHPSIVAVHGAGVAQRQTLV